MVKGTNFEVASLGPRFVELHHDAITFAEIISERLHTLGEDMMQDHPLKIVLCDGRTPCGRLGRDFAKPLAVSTPLEEPPSFRSRVVRLATSVCSDLVR
jgi:hypothetical protein